MKINKIIRIFLMSLLLSFFVAPNISVAAVTSPDGSQAISTSGEMTTANAAPDCEAVASHQKKWSICLFCKLYAAIFNAAQSVALASSNTFGNPFGNLLAIGMALFIAYETLKMVSSFTQQDIRKFLNTVCVQFFKMLIVFLMLKNMGEFYRLIVNPLLLAGFDFGNAVANLSAEGVAPPDTSDLSKGTGGTFGNSIYYAVENFANGCQSRVAQVIALGIFLICFSFEEGWHGFIPVATYLFNGFILFVLGIIIMLSFGFLLIDAMVQMGMFGALAPFCLASWPFKITKKYVSAGWSIFSGVFLTFAMAGVTLKIVFALVGSAISKGGSDISDLATLADSGTAEQLKERLESGFMSVLIALACAILGFRLTGKMSELVGKFGGDAGSGIGSDIGKQAMTAAKRSLKSAAGVAAKGAKAFSDASGLTEKVQNARDKISGGIKSGIGKVSGGIKKAATAPSKAAQKLLGSKTAAALKGKSKEAVGAVKSSIKNSKAGQAVTKKLNQFKNSKVGEGLHKTAQAVNDPKKALKEVDQKLADRINKWWTDKDNADQGGNDNNAETQNTADNQTNETQNANEQNNTANQTNETQNNEAPNEAAQEEPKPMTQDERIKAAEQAWNESQEEKNKSNNMHDQKHQRADLNNYMHKNLNKEDYNKWKNDKHKERHLK